MKQKRRRGLLKRRHKEGRTNYHKRVRMLSSGIPRLVIRKSLKNVTAQIISYRSEGDYVMASATTRELQNLYGWTHARRNSSAAYLLGYLVGKKAGKKDIKKAIGDIGMQAITKGSILFACLKGAVDAGLDVPHSQDLLPSADRIVGKHLRYPAQVDNIKQKIDQALKP